MTRRLLIVDDEPTVRDLCTRVLRGAAFNVTCVASVDEALVCLERGVFDLLITDLRMPGRSGLELIAEVKALYRWLPVIVISGFADSVRSAKHLTIDAVLMKPFQPGELKAAVQNLLEVTAPKKPA